MSAVLSTIVIVVIHTPLWVWGLYAVLLSVGLQRTRDGTVPLLRMLILPLVVTVLAIFSFIAAGPSVLPAALPGLLIGGAVGWQLEPQGASRRLPDGKLWLRGEWWTFAQIVLVLTTRYATNVVAAMVPTLAADLGWRLGALFVSSALSAVFIGRTLVRLRIYSAAAASKAV